MDPITFAGPTSLQGGDSGPAFSEARGGNAKVNSWMASPFAVGAGASASASTPSGIDQIFGSGGRSSNSMALGGLVLGGLALLVAIKAAA